MLDRTGPLTWDMSNMTTDQVEVLKISPPNLACFQLLVFFILPVLRETKAIR